MPPVLRRPASSNSSGQRRQTLRRPASSNSTGQRRQTLRRPASSNSTGQNGRTQPTAAQQVGSVDSSSQVEDGSQQEDATSEEEEEGVDEPQWVPFCEGYDSSEPEVLDPDEEEAYYRAWMNQSAVDQMH